jgi:hypothetical protein
MCEVVVFRSTSYDQLKAIDPVSARACDTCDMVAGWWDECVSAEY